MRWAVLALGISACTSFGSSDGPVGNPTPPQGGDGTSSSSSSSSSGGGAATDGGVAVTPALDGGGACSVALVGDDAKASSCGGSDDTTSFTGAVVPANASDVSITMHDSAFCGTSSATFTVPGTGIANCFTVFLLSDDAATSASVALNTIAANEHGAASTVAVLPTTVKVTSPNSLPWRIVFK